MKRSDEIRRDRGDEAASLRRRVKELESEVAALRKNEEKYRLIADHSGDCLWVMDLATLRFTYVSPAVTRIYGSTVEETLAQSRFGCASAGVAGNGPEDPGGGTGA